MSQLTQSQATQIHSMQAADVSQPSSPYAIVLIAVGAVFRTTSFFYSANTGGDAWARLTLTAEWLKHPVFKIGYGAYPPGHFWLIGLFTLLFHDVVFAGRFLSLVAGIGSLYLVWRLARTLYGEPSGVIALAVFSFYSLHIGYSTTSSAEASYLFFLLAGLMFFFGYFRDESRPLGRLAMGGLSLSVAETIRLEAWAIFFGLGIILAIFEYQDQASRPAWFARWLKPLLTLGLTAGAWPIFSMVYSAIVFHDPMRVLSQHNTLVTGWFKTHPVPLAYQLALGPGALLISLSPLAVLAALYGFLKSWSSRLAASFAALTLFFALVQNYEIATGKLLAMARYTMTLGAMLAVIAGFGCERLCTRLFPGRLRLAYALLAAFLVANLGIVFFLSEHPNRFSSKVASISPRLRYAPHIVGVAHYLRTHMGADDVVVIDNYNEESNIVGQASALPLDPGKRAFLANTSYDETVDQYITREKPRFVVYSDQGTLRRRLNLPPECGKARIEGMDYQCTFANPIYRIYQLAEPAKN
ncbi:MAG: glycosyltransferase family 39 protein [Acidobacteriia bacterium]|nr:glycosyltransferase family 39 protein [Terriglobia bacterium]